MTRLDLKDFGPIAKASVELKPLTVLIGPNNSGKSYLALAIYSLSRALSGESPFGRWTGFQRAWHSRPDLPRDAVRRVRAAVKKAWPTARAFPSGPLKVGDMPPEIQNILTSTLRTFADSLASDFGGELQRCFGTEIGGLGRRGLGGEKYEYLVKLSHDDIWFSWETRSQQDKLMTVNWDAKISNFEYDFTRIAPPRILMGNPDLLVYYTVGALADAVFLNAIGRTHYIPASRSGILLGHKTLASLIVGRSSLAWVEPMKEIPRLPGVITDLIQALLLLRRAGPPEPKLQRVVTFLQGEVARGTVDMDTSLEYPEILYENETGRFQLHQVSSMVSEVAPFILYLKYLVRSGHLFIIEEPESHLDAGNQRNLARAIAMLVNAGVKVLITTHSDYFINQINNLLLLSQLTSRRRLARKYRANEVLKPDDVGAYLFRPGDDGSSVEALDITTDYGILTDMFTNVHSDLYNEAIVLEHSRQ